MESITVRELRNNGGDVLRRVERGEWVILTRDRMPVAEFRPLPRPSLRAAELMRRRQQLPRVSLAEMRSEIDELIDPLL